MNGQTDKPPTMPSPAAPPVSIPSGNEHQPLVAGSHSWVTASVAGAIMILLALVGVALTNSQSQSAQTYWISLVPVYGVLCIGTAWARARHDKAARGSQIVRQVLHWLAIAAALALDFVIRGTGEETATAAGLNAMLLLALGCFLAGVHLEWFFAIVGVILALAIVTVAKAQQYVWLFFLLGVFAVVAMFAGRRLLARWHARKGANQQSFPSSSVGS